MLLNIKPLPSQIFTRKKKKSFEIKTKKLLKTKAFTEKWIYFQRNLALKSYEIKPVYAICTLEILIISSPAPPAILYRQFQDIWYKYINNQIKQQLLHTVQKNNDHAGQQHRPWEVTTFNLLLRPNTIFSAFLRAARRHPGGRQHPLSFAPAAVLRLEAPRGLRDGPQQAGSALRNGAGPAEPLPGPARHRQPRACRQSPVRGSPPGRSPLSVGSPSPVRAGRWGLPSRL